MNYYDFMMTSSNAKKLADQGVNIIEALKNYLLKDLSNHILIKQETQYSLLVSYYGYPLIFRIEIQLDKQDITGQIVAYSQSYDVEPLESPLGVAYPFDTFGNINRSLLVVEFAPRFISDVFFKMHENGVILRP